MSTERRVFIFCNECGVTLDYDEHGATAEAVRAIAAGYGWIRSRGRDICVACKPDATDAEKEHGQRARYL